MHPLPPIGRCRPGVDWILSILLNPVLLGLANWDSMSGAPAHRTCCEVLLRPLRPDGVAAKLHHGATAAGTNSSGFELKGSAIHRGGSGFRHGE